MDVCPVTDDIVISGISGKFPESNNVEEFKQNLYNGVDMVLKDVYKPRKKLSAHPISMGQVKNLDLFDPGFFNVFPKLANLFDPQLRILMEASFEALIDAGINPNEVRGSRTGVYIGCCTSDPAKLENSDNEEMYVYDVKSLLPNRLSYTLDFKGPSMCIDTACSSALVALHLAVQSIQKGECDAALVGGANLCRGPESFAYYAQMNLLSPDGKCKSFDASADGFVRSEAIAVMYVQKARNARRIYATVVGSGVNNDGYKERSAFTPSGAMFYELIKEVYDATGVDPATVAYVEAHGPGTAAGDPQEGYAIARLFCEGRKEPLPLGSVKSNIGHTEGVAGICSIIKVILAMERGVIPANLHYTSPLQEIPALVDGSLKVVTENQPLLGDLVGINSLGIGGVNAHVLLRSNKKTKRASTERTIPRLVVVAGRTLDGANTLLDKAENCNNDDLLSLFDKVFSTNIKGYEYRGFAVLGQDAIKELNTVTSKHRPLWFVYSGMGSQWAGMAKDMMQLETFRNSIKSSAAVLKEFGVDLEFLLLKSDEAELQNILNLLVCITSVQIALTDLLRSVGVVPDGIVGHSVGETACAYADGCLTAKQTIQAAYFRGRAFLETHLLPGAMAAVELSWDECLKRCPPGIYPACNNSKSNVTISGMKADVEKFVAQLQQEKIFAKVVKGPAQAFHCDHVADAAPILLQNLLGVVTTPKPRSSKWVTSSVPKEKWGSESERMCSAEYLVNNLKSPVLFYEAMQFVPVDAVVVELAPHSLLHSILADSMGADATYLSLMRRAHANNLVYCLSSIGRIFNAGCEVDLSGIYKSTFPVSRGTEMIAPLIKWDHSEKWRTTDYSKSGVRSGQTVVIVDLDNVEHQYLTGHVVDGHVVFPAAGYLEMVWKIFAKQHEEDFENFPVVLEDVQFHHAAVLFQGTPTKFMVNIYEGSGGFEVFERGSLVISGKISKGNELSEFLEITPPVTRDEIPLNGSDCYKIMRLRGYHYSGLFRGILESDQKGRHGKLLWQRNWTAFIDTVLQMGIVGEHTPGMFLPTGMRRVLLDPLRHSKLLEESPELPVIKNTDIRLVQSGGVQVCDVTGTQTRRREQVDAPPALATFQFVPFENTVADDPNHALLVIAQIVLENSANCGTLKVAELSGNVACTLKPHLDKQTFADIEYTVVNPPPETNIDELDQLNIKTTIEKPEDAHLWIAQNVELDVKPGTFVLLKSSGSKPPSFNNLEVITTQFCSASESYVLLRRPKTYGNDVTLHITEDFASWVEPLKEAMEKSENDACKIHVVAENGGTSGIVGLVNCLKFEPGGGNLRAFVILDQNAEKFSLASRVYAAQAQKDLVFNVLDERGRWGTYRHLDFDREEYCKEVGVEHANIVNTPGNLGSMRWVQSGVGLQKSNADTEVVSVYYAAINFRDVLIASGRMPPIRADDPHPFGIEFSGRDSTGRRVMGLLESGSLATTCFVDQNKLYEVPKEWSLEDAATISSVYLTCYYGLIMRAQLRKGESILIHAGAGGIGIAAITIALHMECEIFTTVGSDEKRDFLKQLFPQLQDDHIGNSRDTSFKHMVMTLTHGRGVDVILNSFAGEQLMVSLRCLADEGRFVEIGKYDMVKDTPLGMSAFLNNKLLVGVVLNMIGSQAVLDDLKDRVIDGMHRGVVKPLPRTVFNSDSVEAAFRLMSSGKHTGKLLIKLREEEESYTIPKPIRINAAPRTYFDPEMSYLVVGGLGGFGLELVKWMISKGARKIVVTSRNGIKTGYQAYCVESWSCVEVSLLNAACYSDAVQLVEECGKLGPLGGVFNVALVVRDGLFQNQSVDAFKNVAAAKIDVTANLDKALRALRISPDHFVSFSSAVAAQGNPGQANYGYANSAVEKICERRRADGLAALAIQWGYIGDVGYVVEKLSGGRTEYGLQPQPVLSCLELLDVFLRQPHPIVLSAVFGTRESSVAHLHPIDAICKILGIKDAKSVPQTTTLGDFGIDSLLAIGIRNTLERNYNIVKSVQEIRELTFGELVKFSADVVDRPTAPVLEVQLEVIPSKVLVVLAQERPGPPVFFVHQGDGSVKSLSGVARLIHGVVYGLQYTRECPSDTIESIARYYVKQMKTIQQNGPYVLVGYSLGACIAFEIALQLQSLNEAATLILVEGSHKIVSLFEKSYDKNFLMRTLIRVSTTEDQILEYQTIDKFNTPQEKIDYVTSVLSKVVPYTEEDTRATIAGWYHRLEAGLRYVPATKFSGAVSFFRVKEGSLSDEDDYGLNSVCNRKVVTCALDGNHDTIVLGESGKRIAEEINKVLVVSAKN